MRANEAKNSGRVKRPGPPTRLTHTAERLIGRESELAMLDNAWGDDSTHIVVIRGKGGEGKTSLVATWMAQLAADGWRGAEAVYDWSFYSQGTRDQSAATAENFIVSALQHFGDPDPNQGGFEERGTRLAQLIGERQCLLVLDGLEPLQYPPGPMLGQLKDPGMAKLLKGLAEFNRGLCVVTTREKVDEVKQHYRQVGQVSNLASSTEETHGRLQTYPTTGTCIDHSLEFLAPPAGAELLHFSGARLAGERSIEPNDPELQAASREVGGHALTLMLVGQYLQLMTNREFGDIRQRDCLKLAEAEAQYKTDATRPYGHAFKAIEAYEVWLSGTAVSAVSSPTNHGRDDRATLESRRQLAVLRLLGLFDRPATRDCLAALRAERIEGLNEPLVDCSERDWNIARSRLAEINLVSVQSDESVDCHPLIREYFAMRLRGIGFQPVNGSENDRLEAYPTDEVWRAAHRRLYEHLCETTKEGDQPTLEDLQPLYQAVAHGCLAGLVQEALNDVYVSRILRGQEIYSGNKLGAIGSDLGAIACFFETPWRHLSKNLTARRATVLNEAAFNLRALGRLTESLEPMHASLEDLVTREDWKSAAACAGNLSELELTLGEVSGALSDAERSVTYADRSGDAFQRMSNRTTHADALHQSGGGLGAQPKSAAGSHSHAESLFREAEQMQADDQPAYPLLYSLRGFKYCDLLLAPAERQAWRILHQPLGVSPRLSSEPDATEPDANALRLMSRDGLASLSLVAERPSAAEPLGLEAVPRGEKESGKAASQSDAGPSHSKTCRDVKRRAETNIREHSNLGLLSIALDHLTLARAALYEAIFSADSSSSFILPPASFFDSAVSGLRSAGTTHHLPRALLTRAWHRSLLASRTGTPARRDPADGQECPSYSDSAQSDLDEAWEIASRGPMPLFLADIHLHRARLFGEPRRVSARVVGAFEQPDARGLTASGSQPEDYPWQSPEHDLAEARRLIEKHGYGRRLEELHDAEKALRETNAQKQEHTDETAFQQEPESMPRPTVFISYSHDSDAHRDRVLGLSERLRQYGIETILDRYVEGSPAEGWPRWMLNGLDAATHVLCVCTETYYRRFRGHEDPNKGKGVDWEGAFITQALYDAKSANRRFIPVLYDLADEAQIPEPLRGQSFHLLDPEDNYSVLYDLILRQAGVAPGEIGELKPRPRPTGQPATFGASAESTETAPKQIEPASNDSPALRLWREKLDFLLVEEAICSDPETKFSLKHRIEEARQKIRELEA